MAVFWAATSMAARPASSKPVVPMTAFTPWRTQACRCSSVPSGRVKSIRQSAPDSASRLSVMATPVCLPAGAGVLAQRGRVLAVQRHRQFQAVGGEHGFDQHLAHAAAGACDCNTHVGIPWCQRSGSGACPAGQGIGWRVDRGRAVALLGVLLFLQAGFVFIQTLLGLFVTLGAGRVDLVGLQLGLLVAFPAHQPVVLEPDRELALLGVAVAGLEVVRVVPTVGVQHAGQRGLPSAKRTCSRDMPGCSRATCSWVIQLPCWTPALYGNPICRTSSPRGRRPGRRRPSRSSANGREFVQSWTLRAPIIWKQTKPLS